MGMFDDIHISSDIIKDHDIKCHGCKKFADSKGWQTKDLENVMSLYALQKDDTDTLIRLFKVDAPDEKYWVEYTEKEMEEINAGCKAPWLLYKEGDGHFQEEGWQLKNRKHRSMGELPHQILRTYLTCKDCQGSKSWIEIQIKFTDGVAVSITQLPEGAPY